MLTFNKFFLALAFLGGSAAAQAADGALKTSERMDRTDSEIRHGTSGVWRQDLSQQSSGHPHAGRSYYPASYQNLSGTHNGLPVAWENLSGHYNVGQLQAIGSNLSSAGTIGPGVSVQPSLHLVDSAQSV